MHQTIGDITNVHIIIYTQKRPLEDKGYLPAVHGEVLLTAFLDEQSVSPVHSSLTPPVTSQNNHKLFKFLIKHNAINLLQ